MGEPKHSRRSQSLYSLGSLSCQSPLHTRISSVGAYYVYCRYGTVQRFVAASALDSAGRILRLVLMGRCAAHCTAVAAPVSAEAPSRGETNLLVAPCMQCTPPRASGGDAARSDGGVGCLELCGALSLLYK